MLFKKKENKETKNYQGSSNSTVGFKGEEGYMPSQDTQGEEPNKLPSQKQERTYQKPTIPNQQPRLNSHSISPNNVNPTTIAIEFKKLNIKVDSLVNWINQFYSRFSSQIESVVELNSKLSKTEETNSNLEPFLLKINSLEKEFYSLKQDTEDLKKRAEVFIGTEELLKLNDNINNNLQELKKTESGVKEKLESLNNSKSSTNKQSEKIAVDLLEKTAILAKENKESIGKFKYEEYKERTDSILKVMENLSNQISEIKKQLDSYSKVYSSESSSNGKNKKSKQDTAVLEKSDLQFLEDIGEIPELPELPPSPKSKNEKNKKNNKK